MITAITGSTGFVGKNLLSYLDENGHDSVELNLRSDWKSSFDDQTYSIIHLAGKAHDLKKTSVPDEYYQTNYELTKIVYDFFLTSTAKKFIFISSVKAAADSVEGILDEEVTPNPQTIYGQSKLLAEQYIQSQPLPEGKSFFILRPCMIHGPGNKGNLNLLYQMVKKGIPYPLAAFCNRRSFLNVANLCFVIKKLIESSCIGSGIYNVSDDDALSTKDVVSILASGLNVKPKLWKVPVKIINLLAKLGDLLHLPLTTERLKKLTESYVVSNEKIKHALHIDLPYSTKEGLISTANSFKSI